MKKTILTLAAFATASLATTQGAAIHNGLINYWSLDGNGSDTAGSFAEGASTVADDVTAGGTTGAATISASGGLFGGAGVFERTVATDGRLAAADSADVDFSGESLTTSLWVQFDNDDTGWQAILGKGEGSQYRIAIENNNNDPANNAPGYAGGTGDIFQQLGTNVQDGTWHHIVAITNNGGTTELYVNGALEATGGGPAAIGGTNPNANELWIGSNPGQNPGVRMWDGQIDDVAQWGRALSAQEVSEIFAAGSGGTALGSIIPEPSTGLLGALAGLLLIARRRR
ncbi:LamG domain-containing protein [Akkermansiaceae bacterium]|nr:LamG domain-containing protein [Akkermansiaceae bacterium]MDA7888197.1 LamG domain-containing protein [Akkermansiaceae bacterium]